MNDRFFIYAAAVAVIFLSSLFVIDQYAEGIVVPNTLFGFVVVFSGLTYILHAWLLRANERSPKAFITYFTGSISIKLFFTLIFLLVYLYFNRSEKWIVGLTTIVVYLTFTAMEVVSLYKKITSK